MAYKYTDSTPEKSHPDIILDLDGVCAKTRQSFLSRIEDIYGVEISNSILYGSNPEIEEISSDFGSEVKKICSESLEIYRDMDAIPGSPEATRRLSRRYNIRIVSHRVKDSWLDQQRKQRMREISIKWLRDNQIAFDEFVFPTPEDKSDISGDIYIDDRPRILKSVNDSHKDASKVLFLRPHNIRNIPESSWTASELSSEMPGEIARNPRKQWKLVTEHLLDN